MKLVRYFFLIVSTISGFTSVISAPLTPDSAANALFETAVDLTKERLIDVKWSQISYAVREDLCGFESWADSGHINKGLYIYFPESCDAIKRKWSRNIHHDQFFLSSLRKDIINNSVHIYFSHLYTEIVIQKDDLVLNKKIKQHFGNNSSTYKKFMYDKKLKKTREILISYYRSDITAKSIFMNKYGSKEEYLEGISNVDIDHRNEMLMKRIDKLYSRKVMEIREVLELSAYHELISARDIVLEFDSYIEQLSKYNFKEISSIFGPDKKIYQMFSIYLNHLKGEKCQVDFSKVECVKGVLNTAHKMTNNRSGLRHLGMFVEVLDSTDSDQIKEILKSYATDSGSREIRYWERVWSLGTMAGLSLNNYGSGDSGDATLFFPLGIITSKGTWFKTGMFHFIDLGQYVNYSDVDKDISVRDAFVPGITWVMSRKRRYPITFGVDVSYIPKSPSKNRESDIRYSIFAAFEFPLWEIN